MQARLRAAAFGLSVLAWPLATAAGTLEGVGIGAGTGAVIAGPPGAVVGGVIGAIVGGPDLVRRRYYHSHRSCWRDRYGDRHCSWR